ncbi:MAG: hypothetical protein GYB21_04420 [Oceanospirillales bacterium]|nr:hypothetical protein [Oceanospirillales bacterium]
MPLTLAVQSLQTFSRQGETRGADPRTQLDAGRTLSASVKEVVVDTQRPNLFRIKVEAQNLLMELMTSRPLSIGAQVTLSRGSDGALQLSVAEQGQARQTAATAQPSTTIQTSSLTDAGGAAQGLRLQIPNNAQQKIDALLRALPLNQPQTGRVLPSAQNSLPAVSNATATATAQTAADPKAPGSVGTPSTSAPPQSSPQTTQAPTNSSPASASTASDARPANPNPSPATPAQSARAESSQAALSNIGSNNPAPTMPTEAGTRAPTPGPAAGTGNVAQVPQGDRAGNTSPPQAPNVQPRVMTVQGLNSQTATQADTALRPTPVTSPGIQSPASSPNTVQLSVNNQRIELVTPRPLQAGLEVRLTRVDQNTVQLDILPPKISPDAQARMQEGLQQILRDSLPVQVPMGDALNQLRQFSRSDSGRQRDAIGQVVRSMLSMFSVSAKPDAKSTRQAVQQQLNSTGLAPSPKNTPSKGPEGTQPSLKENMARLEQIGERLPAEARARFQSLLQGIQARTATHQAASLQHWQDQPDGSIERQYRLDLPIRVNDEHLDNTEIRITQHKRRDEEDQYVSEWSINLHFNLQDLGAIDSRISLQNEWQITARFWAEQSETAQLIRTRLDDFAGQLNSSGFKVDTLHVERGRQPHDNQAPVSRRLVDLHT